MSYEPNDIEFENYDSQPDFSIDEYIPYQSQLFTVPIIQETKKQYEEIDENDDYILGTQAFQEVCDKEELTFDDIDIISEDEIENIMESFETIEDGSILDVDSCEADIDIEAFIDEPGITPSQLERSTILQDEEPITPTSTILNDTDTTQNSPLTLSRSPSNDSSMNLSDEYKYLPPSHAFPKLNEEKLSLKYWGLPPEVINVYENQMGIKKLFPWQAACLDNVDILEYGKNLIYSAPTSGGKTLVVEIILIKRLLKISKKAIIILPFISIVEEKVAYLQQILEPIGKNVVGHYSHKSGYFYQEEDIAICTFEKANSMINHIIEQGKLDEIGTIVIDEMHMISDRHRGYLLELLLTKLKFLNNINSGSIQIIGMSATLPNIEVLGEYLDAYLFITNFRPVPLQEYIKIGNQIKNKDLQVVREIQHSPQDREGIYALCEEVTSKGNSVLIFCKSKHECEAIADKIAKLVPVNPERDVASVINKLRETIVGLDEKLEKTIPKGVAFHHAGLTTDERIIIEEAYRMGIINILTCTTTLSAGVNLPAQRVIFRSPTIGMDPLDVTRYKQAAGRAGRAGHDTIGESILMTTKNNEHYAIELMKKPLPDICSCLGDITIMQRALIEVIAAGVVETAEDIKQFLMCTFFCKQKVKEATDVAREALAQLLRGRFITWCPANLVENTPGKYQVTPLGSAVFSSNLSIEEGRIIHDELIKAREQMVLDTNLHILYCVAPIKSHLWICWDTYRKLFQQLKKNERLAARLIGINESFISNCAITKPDTRRARDLNIIRHERFFAAMILNDVIQEVPYRKIQEVYKIPRGDIQQLQRGATSYAGMLTKFCQKLNYDLVEKMLQAIQERLDFGAQPDILPLLQIPYIKAYRARLLYEVGYKSLEAIANASPSEIEKHLRLSVPFDNTSNSKFMQEIENNLAEKIVKSAQEILQRQELIQRQELAARNALEVPKSKPIEKTPPPSQNKRMNTPPIFTNSQRNVRKKLFQSPKKQPYTQKSSPTKSPLSQRMSQQTTRDTFKIPTIKSPKFKPPSKIQSIQVNQMQNTKQPMRLGVHYNPGLTNVPKKVKVYEERPEEFESNSQNFTLPEPSPQKISPAKKVSQFKPPRRLTCIPTNTMNSNTNLKKTNLSIINNSNINKARTIPPRLLDEPSPKRRKTGKKQQEEFVYTENYSLPFRITRVNSVEEFDSFCALLRVQERYSFRFYATELPQRGVKQVPRHQLRGVAFCWSEWLKEMNYNPVKMCYYVDFNIDRKKRLAKLKEILSNPNTTKVCFAMKEQLRILLEYDIEVEEELADPKIAAWTYHPEDAAEEKSLEQLMRHHLKSISFAGSPRNPEERTAKECVQAWVLMMVLDNLLDDTVKNLFRKVEMQLVPVLARMEFHGIQFDKSLVQQYTEIVKRKQEILKERAHEQAGREFLITSPQELAHILYDVLKIPPPPESNRKKGKSRHRTTKEDVLRERKHCHEIIPTILEFRKLQTTLTKFIRPLPTYPAYDSKSNTYRIYSKILHCSSCTGRLAYTDPNLQTICHAIEFESPDDPTKMIEVNIRRAFIPSQGYVFLSADYCQAEVRILCHFSKDQKLIDIVSNPKADIFQQLAAQLFNKHPQDVEKKERDQAKRVTYAIIYGSGPMLLSKELEIPYTQAQDLINSFKNKFPNVAKLMDNAPEELRLKGYVESIHGRKRYIPQIFSNDKNDIAEAKRKALNTKCQSSAADIIKVAMINIDAQLQNAKQFQSQKSLSITRQPVARLLLQLHDELLFEVKEEYIDQVKKIVRECMENAASVLSVPIPAKIRIGPNWSDLKECTD